MRKRQGLIPEASLPGLHERFTQAEAAAKMLAERGYVRVGLDHFAQPDDPMAATLDKGGLNRNFQGYTTDDNPVLLGIGVSSIGRLPQGYVQNTTDVSVYRDRLRYERLPTVRGISFSGDDRARGAVIERLMCDLAVDLDSVVGQFNLPPDCFDSELARLEPLVADGIARRCGSRIEVTEEGRPLLRAVAALFDSYLTAPTTSAAAPRHSSVV